MSLDLFQEINGKLFPISSFCFTVNKLYEKWDMLPAGGVYIYKAESFFPGACSVVAFDLTYKTL